MNNWYESFLRENLQKKKTDYSRLISQRDSLSDGINHLPTPSLYRNMLLQSIAISDRLNGYTLSAGHPLLLYGIQYYERFLAGASEDYAKYVCITAGATSAIQMTMHYLLESKKANHIILAGMSYYLFQKIAEQCGTSWKTVLPESGCFPTSVQLCSEIAKNPWGVVILTQPANPSGELYTEAQLSEVIRACHNHHSTLLLDICQMDELTAETSFLNYGKLIIREEAIDDVIIINSFSKIRSLAGARLGYIVTSDVCLFDFVSYCNEMLYFNHPLGYEYAIIMDLTYRMVLRTGENQLPSLLRNIRNIILQTTGIEAYNTYFKSAIRSKMIYSDARAFQREVKANMKIIHNNYRYALEKVSSISDLRITSLQGGYNFCIYLPNYGRQSEAALCKELSDYMRTGLLFQSCFCTLVEEGCDGYWFRVSAAMSEEKFKQYITKFIEWSDLYGNDRKQNL